MKTLLQIQASLFGGQSQSSRLADEFAANWLQRHPQGRIVKRDLSASEVPHLTSERFQAFGTEPPARSPQQQAVVDFSDALIDELKAADVITLAVPMYNFSVPSTLRAYFDHIARAGVTFRYSSSGAEGLIKGKKAYVFITRGGFYTESADTQTPYLRQFLDFIGISDVEFIHAEGLGSAAAREKSLAAARDAIAAVMPVASAA